MNSLNKKNISLRRKNRTRSKIRGSSVRPRVSVYTSLTGMYVQIINDEDSKTLIAMRDFGLKGTKTERAKELGKLVAKKAKTSGINSVVFDRGSKKYHGRVAALAQALRDGGLTI
jgi:large subunit ribosomal protein L18